MDNESTMYTRKLDDLGRVAVPSELRGRLGWEPGRRLVFSMAAGEEGALTVRAEAPCCTLCDREHQGLVAFKRGYICPDCRNSF